MIEMRKTFAGLICLVALPFLAHSQTAVPVVKEHFPIRELAWDSTDRLFAYMERDTILLRSSSGYDMLGTVEFPGVLGFSLYHEDESDVQIIAGAADGTLAVWSVPSLNTPPPISDRP